MPLDAAGRYGLKIGIESVTRCLGRCQGCALSVDQRRDDGPWDPHVMGAVGAFLSHLRDTVLPTARSEINEFFLLCGQGDHLLMREQEIASFLGWLRATTGGTASAEITTSLVGRPERLRQAIQTVHRESIRVGQTLLVAVVFDPDKANHLHYGSPYLDLIADLRARFGTADFGLNLGPDTVARVTPQQMHRFLVSGGFKHFEINLTPRPATAAAMARAWPQMMAWLREVHRLWLDEPAYDLGHGYMLSGLWDQVAQEGDDAFMTRLSGSLSRFLYLTHEGAVHLGLTGGTGALVPLVAELGWKPVADLTRHSPAEVTTRLPVVARRTAAALQADYQRDPRCAACPVQRLCQISGMATVRAQMAGRVEDTACPAGIRGVLEDVVQAHAHHGRRSHNLAFEAVQTGLDPSTLGAEGRGRSAATLNEPAELTRPAWIEANGAGP